MKPMIKKLKVLYKWLIGSIKEENIFASVVKKHEFYEWLY
jgi:hypothetical protein